MKKMFKYAIIAFALLSGCKAPEVADNAYYQEKYEIEESEIKIISLSLDEAFDIKEKVKENDYILMIITESCAGSRTHLQDFIKSINKNNYGIDKLYILEVNGFSSDEDKKRFVDTFQTEIAPTTIFYKDKKEYLIEIGYFSEDVLIENIEKWKE